MTVEYSMTLQITYDIYKPFFAKNATSEQLLWVSRVAVAFFGLIMAVVSVIFYKVDPGPCILIIIQE